MLKVYNLIEVLQEMSPDAIVLVRVAHTGGLDAIEAASEVRVALDVHHDSFYGPHETLKEGEPGAS